MKKILIILLLLSATGLMAQAYPDRMVRNEVKFNMGLFLATTTLEGSYERFITDDMSIGATIYFDNDASDYNGDFGIGPNFRAYFGYGYAEGFFAEAFGLYYTGKDQEVPLVNPGDQEYNTFALGLGLGGKWATRSQKFSFEINGGFGRNINPEIFQDSFMYRFGASIGFRF
jgi:hypothetical protein